MQKHLTKFLIILIGATMVYTSSNLNWYKNTWLRVIGCDAKGYYAYLPALFIYDDPNFGYYNEIENEKYYHEFNRYEYRVKVNERYVDRYFCGVAVLQAPFFFIAHGLSHLLDYPTDGYSKLYIFGICMAAIFYLCLGLFFLDNILKRFGVTNAKRVLTILAVAFGTHAFYYTVGEPGMSHIYSFALIAGLIYYGQKYFEYQNKWLIPLLAVIYALIGLVRPANLIAILLLPFIAENFSSLKSGIQYAFKKWPVLLLSIVLCVSIGSLQFIYYKMASGQFIVDTYGEEGFNFLDPHFIDILFSYKKGLFVYTPMLLLSLAGIFFLWKRNRFQTISLGLFLVILTYVLSSWWSWWYGGSFSSRAFVEYIPLFAILLGIMLQDMKKIYLRWVVVVMVFCTALNQIQTYQYRYMIIHWDNMDKKKYWDVFLELPS